MDAGRSDPGSRGLRDLRLQHGVLQTPADRAQLRAAVCQVFGGRPWGGCCSERLLEILMEVGGHQGYPKQQDWLFRAPRLPPDGPHTWLRSDCHNEQVTSIGTSSPLDRAEMRKQMDQLLEKWRFGGLPTWPGEEPLRVTMAALGQKYRVLQRTLCAEMLQFHYGQPAWASLPQKVKEDKIAELETLADFGLHDGSILSLSCLPGAQHKLSSGVQWLENDVRGGDLDPSATAAEALRDLRHRRQEETATLLAQQHLLVASNPEAMRRQLHLHVQTELVRHEGSFQAALLVVELLSGKRFWDSRPIVPDACHYKLAHLRLAAAHGPEPAWREARIVAGRSATQLLLDRLLQQHERERTCLIRILLTLEGSVDGKQPIPREQVPANGACSSLATEGLLEQAPPIGQMLKAAQARLEAAGREEVLRQDCAVALLVDLQRTQQEELSQTIEALSEAAYGKEPLGVDAELCPSHDLMSWELEAFLAKRLRQREEASETAQRKRKMEVQAPGPLPGRRKLKPEWEEPSFHPPAEPERTDPQRDGAADDHKLLGAVLQPHEPGEQGSLQPQAKEECFPAPEDLGDESSALQTPNVGVSQLPPLDLSQLQGILLQRSRSLDPQELSKPRPDGPGEPPSKDQAITGAQACRHPQVAQVHTGQGGPQAKEDTLHHHDVRGVLLQNQRCPGSERELGQIPESMMEERHELQVVEAGRRQTPVSHPQERRKTEDKRPQVARGVFHGQEKLQRNGSLSRLTQPSTPKEQEVLPAQTAMQRKAAALDPKELSRSQDLTQLANPLITGISQGKHQVLLQDKLEPPRAQGILLGEPEVSQSPGPSRGKQEMLETQRREAHDGTIPQTLPLHHTLEPVDACGWKDQGGPALQETGGHRKLWIPKTTRDQGELELSNSSNLTSLRKSKSLELIRKPSFQPQELMEMEIHCKPGVSQMGTNVCEPLVRRRMANLKPHQLGQKPVQEQGKAQVKTSGLQNTPERRLDFPDKEERDAEIPVYQGGQVEKPKPCIDLKESQSLQLDAEDSQDQGTSPQKSPETPPRLWRVLWQKAKSFDLSKPSLFLTQEVSQPQPALNQGMPPMELQRPQLQEMAGPALVLAQEKPPLDRHLQDHRYQPRLYPQDLKEVQVSQNQLEKVPQVEKPIPTDPLAVRCQVETKPDVFQETLAEESNILAVGERQPQEMIGVEPSVVQESLQKRPQACHSQDIPCKEPGYVGTFTKREPKESRGREPCLGNTQAQDPKPQMEMWVPQPQDSPPLLGWVLGPRSKSLELRKSFALATQELKGPPMSRAQEVVPPVESETPNKPQGGKDPKTLSAQEMRGPESSQRQADEEISQAPGLRPTDSQGPARSQEAGSRRIPQPRDGIVANSSCPTPTMSQALLTPESRAPDTAQALGTDNSVSCPERTVESPPLLWMVPRLKAKTFELRNTSAIQNQEGENQEPISLPREVTHTVPKVPPIQGVKMLSTGEPCLEQESHKTQEELQALIFQEPRGLETLRTGAELQGSQKTTQSHKFLYQEQAKEPEPSGAREPETFPLYERKNPGDFLELKPVPETEAGFLQPQEWRSPETPPLPWWALLLAWQGRPLLPSPQPQEVNQQSTAMELVGRLQLESGDQNPVEGIDQKILGLQGRKQLEASQLKKETSPAHAVMPTNVIQPPQPQGTLALAHHLPSKLPNSQGQPQGLQEAEATRTRRTPEKSPQALEVQVPKEMEHLTFLEPPQILRDPRGSEESSEEPKMQPTCISAQGQWVSQADLEGPSDLRASQALYHKKSERVEGIKRCDQLLERLLVKSKSLDLKEQQEWRQLESFEAQRDRQKKLQVSKIQGNPQMKLRMVPKPEDPQKSGEFQRKSGLEDLQNKSVPQVVQPLGPNMDGPPPTLQSTAEFKAAHHQLMEPYTSQTQEVTALQLHRLAQTEENPSGMPQRDPQISVLQDLGQPSLQDATQVSHLLQQDSKMPKAEGKSHMQRKWRDLEIAPPGEKVHGKGPQGYQENHHFTAQRLQGEKDTATPPLSWALQLECIDSRHVHPLQPGETPLRQPERLEFREGKTSPDQKPLEDRKSQAFPLPGALLAKSKSLDLRQLHPAALEDLEKFRLQHQGSTERSQRKLQNELEPENCKGAGVLRSQALQLQQCPPKEQGSHSTELSGRASESGKPPQVKAVPLQEQWTGDRRVLPSQERSGAPIAGPKTAEDPEALGWQKSPQGEEGSSRIQCSVQGQQPEAQGLPEAQPLSSPEKRVLDSPPLLGCVLWKSKTFGPESDMLPREALFQTQDFPVPESPRDRITLQWGSQHFPRQGLSGQALHDSQGVEQQLGRGQSQSPAGGKESRELRPETPGVTIPQVLPSQESRESKVLCPQQSQSAEWESLCVEEKGIPTEPGFPEQEEEAVAQWQGPLQRRPKSLELQALSRALKGTKGDDVPYHRPRRLREQDSGQVPSSPELLRGQLQQQPTCPMKHWGSSKEQDTPEPNILLSQSPREPKTDQGQECPSGKQTTSHSPALRDVGKLCRVCKTQEPQREAETLGHEEWRGTGTLGNEDPPVRGLSTFGLCPVEEAEPEPLAVKRRMRGGALWEQGQTETGMEPWSFPAVTSHSLPSPRRYEELIVKPVAGETSVWVKPPWRPCGQPWFPRPPPPRREKAFIWFSQQEQEETLQRLVELQAEGERRHQRDKERQNLRFQERLCIAKHRRSEDDLLAGSPAERWASLTGHKGQQDQAGQKTAMKSHLEKVKRERTDVMQSKRERNTQRFKELLSPLVTYGEENPEPREG